MNDDLISREDLISRSALKKAFEVLFYNDVDDMERTQRLIDNAPPVFDCNTCKYIGNERECVDCYDYSNYVHYESRPQGEWIPVSEKLPEEETDVLICNINGDVEISRGSYSTEIVGSTEIADEFIWYTSGWKFGKVIAWMPLPKPYKEAENDKNSN